MTTKVKICGLTTPDTMTAAIEAGADFVGLVFYLPSPRYIEIEVAAYLARYVPNHIQVCGLFVDPDDQTLLEVLENVRIDMIQLHGKEDSQRIEEIRKLSGKPVIKAMGVTGPEDLMLAQNYAKTADWLMLDAPGGGGMGAGFNWEILHDFKCPKPWMLAGGLTAENVEEAISRLHPDTVDVSSGVESSRGIKDAAKIRAFVQTAKQVR